MQYYPYPFKQHEDSDGGMNVIFLVVVSVLLGMLFAIV